MGLPQDLVWFVGMELPQDLMLDEKEHVLGSLPFGQPVALKVHVPGVLSLVTAEAKMM